MLVSVTLICVTYIVSNVAGVDQKTPLKMKITLLCLTVLVITVHADTNLRLNRNTALHASHHHYTTCHKTMFGDPRCYKVVSNNYEYIMQCGAGTYFDNNTCSCDLQTSSLPHDLAPVDCNHLHSQLSTSAHSLSTVSCSSSSYSFLELAKTNQHCLSADSVWSHLQLVKTHDSIDCVKKIINDMNAYYGAWNSQHGRMPCACNHVYKYIRKPTEDTSHCYYHDSGFQHLYRTVFGSRDTFNENTIGRSCSSHNTVWKYLELTATKHTSNFCLELLIQIISEAYHNLPGNVQCSSCQETGHTDVTMTVSPVVHSSHDCRQNQAYKELMTIFSTDMCVSYTKVWGPLKAIGSYSHDCLVEAIKELTGRSNHFDNSSCSCSHSSLHDLVLGHISGGQYSDCDLHFHDSYHTLEYFIARQLTNHRPAETFLEDRDTDAHFKATISHRLINQIFGSHPFTAGSQGICASHQTVWPKLQILAESTSRPHCLMDLINYMTVYTNGHTDTCACYPISVSAHPTHQPITTHPTQQPTTTHHATVTVHPCQKIDTLISLAHNAYLLDNAAPCPDGGHSKAEATVVDLCNAPASVSWHKGYNVMDHCNDIPEFSAIASFAGDVYHGDGVAGIFISCNATSIKIATERCDHPMEVVTVVLGARDQYTHMAETYYTIQW